MIVNISIWQLFCFIFSKNCLQNMRRHQSYLSMSCRDADSLSYAHPHSSRALDLLKESVTCQLQTQWIETQIETLLRSWMSFLLWIYIPRFHATASSQPRFSGLQKFRSGSAWPRTEEWLLGLEGSFLRQQRLMWQPADFLLCCWFLSHVKNCQGNIFSVLFFFFQWIK